MNAPTTIAERPARSASKRGDTPLRAWRRRQLVDDPAKPGFRRLMRLTDVERLHGIPMQTWHSWEQWPGAPGFRAPEFRNMKRLFEITGGEVLPEHFYPLDEWKAKHGA